MLTMLESLDLIVIRSILSKYRVLYKVMYKKKGVIFYGSGSFYRKICLNPLFNDNDFTLMHEIVHHYLDKRLNIRLPLSEDYVESLTFSYLNQNPDVQRYLEYYISRRVK